MTRHRFLEVWITYGLIGAIALCGWRVWAASLVNGGIPGEDDPSASAPIRQNFSTIKSELEFQQDLHPSSSTNQVVRFVNTYGGLTGSQCAIFDTGQFKCDNITTNVGGSYGVEILNAGASGIAKFEDQGTSNGLYVKNTGNVIIRDSSANTAFVVTQTGSSADAFSMATGSGGSGDMALQLNEANGLCLRTYTSVDNISRCTVQNRTTTSNSSTTTLQTITLTPSRTYLIESWVTARRQASSSAGTAEDGAVFVLRGGYKTSGGNATVIGAAAQSFFVRDQAGWNATLDTSGATVRVRVQGATNNDVSWHATTAIQWVGE